MAYSDYKWFAFFRIPIADIFSVGTWNKMRYVTYSNCEINFWLNNSKVNIDTN